MGRPNRVDLPTLEELRRVAEETTGFQTDADFKAQQTWVEEQVRLLGAPVHLIPSATERDPQGSLESAGVDDLYGDILDPQFTEGDLDQRKHNVRCILEHEPSKQMLKRFGIDEERDVVFHFPVKSLEELGLVTVRRFRGVDIGDFVVWDRSWYIVKNVHRGAYFGQTDKPYFTSAFTNRYRLNSVPTGETVP